MSKDKTLVDVVCKDCGKNHMVAYGNYRRKPTDYNFRCKQCMSKYKGCIASERYSNMSDDDKLKLSKKYKDMWKNKSDAEKQSHINKTQQWRDTVAEEKMKEILSKQKTNQQKYFDGMTDEDKKRLSNTAKSRWDDMSNENKQKVLNQLIESSKDWRESLTDQQKQEISDRVKLQWESYSDDRRDEIIRKQKESWKLWYDSLSDDDRNDIIDKRKAWYVNTSPELIKDVVNKRKDGLKIYWDNLSTEELKLKAETGLMNLQSYWDNVTDEQRVHNSKKAKERYDGLSNEDRSELLKSLWDGHESWWSSLTEIDKSLHISNLRDAHKIWNDNLTDDDRNKLSMKIKMSWDELSIEDRSNRIKQSLVMSATGNNLHKKFENYFSNSYISNDYYINPEESHSIEIDNKIISKSWDYGIYSRSDNKLVMVVDLDGAYFHANITDYDGIHSREEFDERRFLIVPDGVKIHIIHEGEFSKSFESMIQNLMFDYDEFVINQFKYCRSIPIPYPSYSNDELIKSYLSLIKLNTNSKYVGVSTNNRIGDRIINHFHHSIYSAKVKGSKISPYEAWYNDELLMKVIKNRIVYIDKLNPNKILQGFNIANVAKRVSVFSAGRAKLLIHKYLNEYSTIFDPFSGFSGRMLGAVSLGKNYIGQDISSIHVKESNEVIEFLSLESKVAISQKDILHSTGAYDCLFTCSPYSDKEQWYEVPVNTRGCDDWIDICLNRFKCKKYLFVVDNTEKYKDKIVEVIKNKSHMNSNSEYVILI